MMHRLYDEANMPHSNIKDSGNNPPPPPFIKGGRKLTPPLGKGDTGGFSGEKGFTLIEVLIAMLILAIGLLSLATLATTVINGNAFSNKMTTATTRAQDKMEQLKNSSYASLSSGGPETIQSIYTRQWTVTNDSPAANMKKIQVKVTWSWQGSNHDVVLNTIVAK